MIEYSYFFLPILFIPIGTLTWNLSQAIAAPLPSKLGLKGACDDWS